MLEYFVHLDKDDPPDDLVLAIAEIPDDVTRKRIMLHDLPANWREPLAPAELVRFGDEFVQRGEVCVLLAPSVLVSRENNWLINPEHTDYKRIAIRPAEPLSYDPRLFGLETHGKRNKKHKDT